MPKIYDYVRSMFVWYESSERLVHTFIFRYLVPSICHWTAEQQSLHITGFLRVIYAILNASVILERSEKRLERNKKCLERNETRLARNETRGGNLLLGGTVVLWCCFECYANKRRHAPYMLFNWAVAVYILAMVYFEIKWRGEISKILM